MSLLQVVRGRVYLQTGDSLLKPVNIVFLSPPNDKEDPASLVNNHHDNDPQASPDKPPLVCIKNVLHFRINYFRSFLALAPI